MSMCSLLSLTRGHRGRSLVINARNKLLPLVVVKEPRQAVTAFSALVRASNTGPTTAHNPPRWTLFSSTPNNDGEYGSLLIDRVSSQKRFFRREKDGQSTATTTSISSSTIHGAYSSSSSSSSILEVEPMERRRMYQYLQLQSFSKEELENVYQTILSAAPDTADSTKRSNDKSDALHIAHIRQFLWNRMLDIEAEFEANKHQQYQAGTQGDSHAAEHYKNDRFQYAHEEALRFRKVFPVCNADDNQQGKPQIQIEQDLPGLTKKEFVQTIIDGATALDVGRMWPITLSILLVGTSVGIVTPAMPFVVEKIGLTPGQYGTVVSAFALAKILCNVPSAILVERHGRKPYLTFSLAVIAVGVGGVGAANSFEQLYACRLLTGAGVAALTTASQLMVTDISTPLNRAITMSPIASAFAAGTALGPALGGTLVDRMGLESTFFMVGSSYLGVALVNRMLLEETKPSKQFYLPWLQQIEKQRENTDDATVEKVNHNLQPRPPSQGGETDLTLTEAARDALSQWVPLFQQSKIRSALIMNGFYWFALAGSQMTLLPLMLTDPNKLALSASEVGQVYMLMSVVQVMSNPIMARYVIDRMGATPSITAGCALIASSMTFLPFCTEVGHWNWLAGTLGLWAMGSSMLSTAPLAFISDRVDEGQRAQAIAMLRTSGDLGFLLGASCVGGVANWAGDLGYAMQSSGGLLFAATIWFTTRQTLLNGNKSKGAGHVEKK